MANKTKKDFTPSLDALLTSTVPPKKVTATETREENEKAILLRMSVSLKKRMQHYCIDNQISAQQFIINAIEKFLEEE